MKALLLLSACLSPLVDRTNFANGMSVFLVTAVGPPFMGALTILLSALHIPMHVYPLFWLVVEIGLALWFGEYTKRFVQAHKVEIVARSQTRPWPRMSAVALFALSFLLFFGLVKIAAWIDGQS